MRRIGIPLLLCLLSTSELAQSQTALPAPPQGSYGPPSHTPRNPWRELTYDKAALHTDFVGSTLWVGTEFGGVYRWDTSTGESRNFTRVNDGLVANTVTDLEADGHEVWAGHWTGVSHYDGSSWEVFDETNSPIHSGISVEVDSNGDAWVGTYDQGLFHFDGTTWTQYSTFNSGLSDNFVTSIEEDSQGDLWVGAWGNGVDRFDGTTWTNYNPANSALLSVFVWVREAHATDGRVWFYCHDDDFDPDVGIVLYDGTTWSTVLPSGGGSSSAPDSIHTEYISSVVVDHLDRVWFQGDNAISRYDGANWTLFSGITGNFDYNLPRGSALSVSDDGVLWTATAEGLARFDGVGFVNHATEWLWDMDVASVAIDDSGAAWIGTRGGLQSLDGSTWRHFTTSNSPLPNNQVTSLAGTSTGGILVGTKSGAARFEGRQWTTWTTSNSGLHSNKVETVSCSASGTYWFGSGIFGGGVSRLEGGSWTQFTTGNSGISSNNISRIVSDPYSDDVWFASSLGADRFAAGTWTHYPVGQPAEDALYDVTFAANGDVWFARHQGVSVLSGGVVTDFSSADGLAENRANAVTIDHDGRVWAGHQDSGVSRFNGSTWVTFEASDGLTSNRVKSMTVDLDGTVWFGTGINLGLFNRMGW